MTRARECDWQASLRHRYDSRAKMFTSMFVMIVNIWLELLTQPKSRSSSLRTTSSELKPHLHPHSPPVPSPPALLSSPLRNTFHTIDLGARLLRGVYYVLDYVHLLLSSLYLGTHLRHLGLVEICEDDFSNGISPSRQLRTPISRMLGLPPEFPFLWIELRFYRGELGWYVG